MANTEALYFREILEISPNTYWIGVETGIVEYNPEKGAAGLIKKDLQRASSLSDDTIWSLFKDREGGLWVGTYSGGVNYYPKNELSFRVYIPGPASHSLSGSIVKGIAEDSAGNIWIGTEDNGLNRLDPVTGHITQFSPDEKGAIISYRNLHGIVAAGTQILAGTFHHGLDVINLPDLKKRNYRKGEQTFSSDFLASLFRSKTGKILIGTEVDLVEFDPESASFETVLTDKRNRPFYYCIQEDNAGKIWIGTRGDGVYCLDRGRAIKKEYRLDKASRQSIPNNEINDIFKDSKGNVWVGTEAGLCRYQIKGDNFKRYVLYNGLNRERVFKILEDDAGTLWVSTSQGLFSFDPATGIRRNYTTEDGLPTNRFNYNSGFKAKDGTLYFGSIKGLVSFRPDPQKKFQGLIGKPVITGFQFNEQEALIGEGDSRLKLSPLVSEKIDLPYNKSTFSLNFSTLNPRPVEKDCLCLSDERPAGGLDRTSY
ncbi:hypothetical protein GCM10023091_36990 [Ravibacter arvi]|uniref:Hybrid sensor histidine kinase/response regulator n=1 Tax=Ravibacter arvi TaxID=2051041 RepID=A0ABP8M9Q6_9BACT